MEDNKSTQQKENYTLQPLKEVNVLKDWIPNTKQTAIKHESLVRCVAGKKFQPKNREQYKECQQCLKFVYFLIDVC